VVNLALTPDEAKAVHGDCCSPDSDNLPLYPYGLSLYLNDETLEKLGLTDLPKVGSTMLAQITVTVTGTSQRATQSGKDGETTNTCVDLQITDMELALPAKSAASVLYPAS
jgi:hypothetical protein